MNSLKETVVVIDVGNTSTSIGLSCGGRILKQDRIATAIHDLAKMRVKMVKVAGRKRPCGVVLSSVVPAVNQRWRAIANALWNGVPWVNVNCRCHLGVPITYPKPETIGADRLANACEAAHHYGTSVIVADFGTALTFDVVKKSEGYVGGVIAPGLSLMFNYLSEKTALLPRIQPGAVRHAVGKSTVEAMRLGARWGYRGLVKEILKELVSGLGDRRVKLCATGGYAKWVLHGSGIPMPVDPDLTLRGLARIFELNRKS